MAPHDAANHPGDHRRLACAWRALHEVPRWGAGPKDKGSDGILLGRIQPSQHACRLRAPRQGGCCSLGVRQAFATSSEQLPSKGVEQRRRPCGEHLVHPRVGDG